MEVVSSPSRSGSENNTKIRNDHGLHIGTPNGSHEHASEALSAARDGFTCNHAIAEVFGTLSGGRLGFSYPRGKQPNFVEANIIERRDILELTASDYRKIMAECQTAGARGGAIFDMLHLHAARRGKAARIFTINVRHFQAFAPDLKNLIALPR